MIKQSEMSVWDCLFSVSRIMFYFIIKGMNFRVLKRSMTVWWRTIIGCATSGNARSEHGAEHIPNTMLGENLLLGPLDFINARTSF